MSVKINSTGGGSVTLDSGSTANNVTLSLPGTAGTVAALASVTNNGVAYVNSSGQPTSGSALTFDGTNLGIGTGLPAGKLNVVGSSGLTALRVDGVAANLLIDYGGSGNNYYDAANHYFRNYAASNLMTLDSSGNLGLGVTPSAFSASYKGFEIGAVGNALTSANTVVNLSTNAFRGASWTYGATGRALLYQQDSGAGAHFWFNAPSGTAGNAISFTQAMTLDASGNLLVATTSKVGRLTVKQTTDDYGYGIAILMSNSTNHWQQIAASDTNFYFGYNGVGVARINSGTGAYTAISDERLKKDIENISLGLTTVLNLRPVEYLMNHETSGSQKHLGFIAQESKLVIPSAVSEMTDGILGMDKTEIIPVLVKAIQELSAKVDAQAAEIAALKAK